MSKKRSRRQRKQRRGPRLSATQMQFGVASQLHQARKHLQQGSYGRVFTVLDKALNNSPTPAEQQTIRQLQAEAHLGNALTQQSYSLRLRQIDAALDILPNSPRLRFYRGLTLAEIAKWEEAEIEFEIMAEQRPDWPGGAFLIQLTRLAQGKSWQTAKLSQTEINTLHFGQTLADGNGNELPPGPFLGDDPTLWQMLAELNDKDGVVTTSCDPALSEQSISEFVGYYAGIAALRNDDWEEARRAFAFARPLIDTRPWVSENVAALLRLHTSDLAKQQRWQEIVDLAAESHELLYEDRILAEITALAHNHLGYEYAQAQAWEKAADHWQQANAYAGSRQLAQNLALAAEALEDWEQAAEGWRDMIRRRPRVKTHPDYLDAAQVAALWLHTATCYKDADDLEQAIVCLRNADKYAGDNVDISIELVSALMLNDQFEAAYNKLEELLVIEPDNIDLLKHQAMLYMQAEGGWYHEAITTWRKVLALNPDDETARAGLAKAHIENANFQWFKTSQQRIDYYLKALKDVPGHPVLSVYLAKTYEDADQLDKAVETLQRAANIHPDDSRVMDTLLHEMIHFPVEDHLIEDMIGRAREMPRLLPAFWLSQIEDLLHCRLDKRWIDNFIAEAIALTDRPYVDATKAALLVEICELLDVQGEEKLARRCLQRLRIEEPQSGAVEYIMAMSDLEGQRNYRQTRRLLRTARRLALRAKEQVLLARIEDTIRELESDDLPPDLMEEIIRRYPNGPPSPDMLEAIVNDYINS